MKWIIVTIISILIYGALTLIYQDRILNWSSWTAFTISIFITGVYTFFLTPKQLVELFQPKDGLSQLRLFILLILLITVFSSVPSLVYQFYRMIGDDYQVLRNVATVTSRISVAATTILMILVFTYRRKS